MCRLFFRVLQQKNFLLIFHKVGRVWKPDFLSGLGTGSLLGGTFPGGVGMSKFWGSWGETPPILLVEKSLLSHPHPPPPKKKYEKLWIPHLARGKFKVPQGPIKLPPSIFLGGWFHEAVIRRILKRIERGECNEFLWRLEQVACSHLFDYFLWIVYLVEK